MPLLKDKDKEQLRKVFAGITHPVTLVFFTQEQECQYCSETREILEEVEALSEKIQLEVHDLVADADLAREYRVSQIPATVLVGDRDYGIRYVGVPAGYEFTSLVEDILMVGRRDAGLAPATVAALAGLKKPVHMQVLVSTTCPHCLRAARVAHQFAMASEQVTADVVEISEFPQLAVKYQVQGVPATVINETVALVGAQPESAVLEKVLAAGK